MRAGINVPFCYTRAMSLYSVKTLTLPSIPNNGGMAAPITVEAPKGCILDAQHPFATGGRHAMGHFVVPLIYGALAKAAPDRVQADSGMMNLVTFQGRHRNGRGVSTIYFAAGGYGALDGTDGAPTVPHPSNMAVVPVEIWETITSTTIERKELLTDSGGAGAWRGGLGQEVVVRNDSGGPMTLLGMGNRTQFPPAASSRAATGRCACMRSTANRSTPRPASSCRPAPASPSARPAPAASAIPPSATPSACWPMSAKASSAPRRHSATTA